MQSDDEVGALPVTDEIERVARAIDDSCHGYEIKLTALVDGVSTYTARFQDEEPREFVGVMAYSDASEYIEEQRSLARARAAIAALSRPTSPDAP